MYSHICTFSWIIILFFNTPDFDKAEKLFQEGKYEQSEILFEKIYKENSENYKAKEYLGDIAGHQQQWDKAIKHYELLKNKFPKNAVYHYKYGGALGMKAKNSNKFKAFRMIDEVENSFLKAVALDKNFIDAHWALVELYLQLPGIAGGSEKKSRKYAEKLQLLSAVDGYLAKGRIESYFKRYKKAEIYYLKAFETGKSKNTFEVLYDLYQNKMKAYKKAEILKEKFTANKS